MATDFGYDAYHWYYHILQNAWMTKKQRKVNCWNTFIALFLEPINNTLPEGVPKKRVSDPDIAVRLKEAWDAMTKDEQEIFTTTHVKEMEEAREVQDITTHNTAIAAFYNVRTSMQSIMDQLRDLYLCTGLKVLMFGVRGSKEHFNQLFVLSTSDKGTDFFHTCFKQLPSIWVTSFEAYVLLGVDGMKSTQAIELLRLKGACSTLVLEQMRTVAAPANIPKIYYQDFYEQFTLRHHIVYED
ncbi:hypothetical protein QCA50_019994 [Cerrena zonata]|uniref:HMG box domain-containing protein n=1 Tax=Cerrena zonata TaxID=2478898 RepID=A0AAW0FE40_9APHY